MRGLGVFAVALCTMFAGCGSVFAPTPTPTPSATPDPTPTPTPDRVGYEDGYAADATLDVNASDGLDDAELDALVARTIARVEAIRGVEFDGEVTVELLTREAYLARNLSVTPTETRASDQRWEAAFMVGEGTDSQRVVDALFGGAVAGYYLPSEDRIGLLVPEDGGVDTRTLAHELVHALQDQRGWDVSPRPTIDGRLAGRGLTEGEAVAVTRAYGARCGEAWSCLPVSRPGGGNVSAIVAHPGVFLTFRAPYVAGPDFVAALRERGADDGWAAVTDAYGNPPSATRELLDPSVYPADEPTLDVEDRSSDGWRRYAEPDSLGRATVHSMIWVNGLVSKPDDAISTDYRDPYSEGLVADRFVPYANGRWDGYVWRLRFENASEAAEFFEGYRRLLVFRQNADRVRAGLYVIEEGPFADAFRVTRRGATVTVVNAPTVDALDAVHSNVEAAQARADASGVVG